MAEGEGASSVDYIEGKTMNLKGVANRIRRGDVHYALGRFKTVRSAYSGARRLMETITPGAPHTNGSGQSLFPDADVGRIIKSIREEAVYVGLNLPPKT